MLGRASVVLQGVKQFLQKKRTEDLKGLRFSIPPNIYNSEGFLRKLSILVAQTFHVISSGPPLWEK